MNKELIKDFEEFLKYDMQQDYFYKILSWCRYDISSVYEIKLHCDININEEEREYMIEDRFINYLDTMQKNKCSIEEICDFVAEHTDIYSDFLEEEND